MDLSFKDYFKIDEEDDNVAVMGHLKCNCSCEDFRIFHTGKQTKGILSSYIKKENNQIFSIEAKCSKCGKIIKIYDTLMNGKHPVEGNIIDKKQFIHKDYDIFKIKIMLNYYKENYMTNKFAAIYVILIENNNKEIVLYEE